MGLQNWIQERQIRSFVSGICNTFVTGSNAHLKYAQKKNIKIKSYADLAATTLKDRPGWKELRPREFEYKNGNILVIYDDYSVADVILLVILNEYSGIMKVNPIPHPAIGIIRNELKNKFKNYTDDKLNGIIWKWEIDTKKSD